MIRHVVLLTFHPGTSHEQVQSILDGLATLPAAIDAIADYRFGSNLGIEGSTSDLAVVADFADSDAYVTYRDHPAHRAVIAERIAPVLASRASVQYELTSPDAV